MKSIDTIMIFAAGRGTRMYPLTENLPKSLIRILGKPILYWVLDIVRTYPFKTIIINTHYCAEQIVAAVQSYQNLCKDLPEIIFSHEEQLLETGGGLKKALQYTSSEAVFTLNSDSIIFFDKNPFYKLLNSWHNMKMDINLLLHETEKAIGYKGKGDFFREENGFVSGIELICDKPFMYTGLQLIKTEIIKQQPDEIFSLKEFYFEEKYKQRIFSEVNYGHWVHATHPEDISIIENYINSINI